MGRLNAKPSSRKTHWVAVLGMGVPLQPPAAVDVAVVFTQPEVQRAGDRCAGVSSSGAAQESNLPSLGLPDLTGFEDRLGHRAHAAPTAG
jgi:hypothetical protein